MMHLRLLSRLTWPYFFLPDLTPKLRGLLAILLAFLLAFFGSRFAHSSPGSITVNAGLGLSMSTGPQVAISLTNFGRRLSLRT